MTLKELINKYYQPTPKKCRRFGDSLLIACSGAIMYASNDHIMLKVLLIGMIVGKFISNFFTEDNNA